jgi:transcriptional regulator with XRE-family HTH domain
MPAMNSAQDRDAFSQRLRLSLDRAGWKVIGATGLAREFNRRSSSHPVTAHATRKWLQGEAIPAQGRLQELARWLQVPPQWLRFGDEDSAAVERRAPAVSEVSGASAVSESSPTPYMPELAAKLAADLARLTPEQLQVIATLVGLLLSEPRRPEQG